MIKQAFHIIKNMGLRYTLYRARHEWEKRTGALKRRHPVHPAPKHFISLDEWRNSDIKFLFPEREKLDFIKRPDESLMDSTRRIIDGDILFFSSEWKKLGAEYDWITNPENGYRYDIEKHWSEIPDFSPLTGDIKYVWEKSRFTFLHTIIRNDYHNDEDHAEFVFSEIEHWIDCNPVNQGPNWRCSQETSLRIFNWCFALSFYKNSLALTTERWEKIQHVIYWSLHHVYHHIDFSRIAVRNNHAITETLFLTLSELLFPYIPEARAWARDGRKWFEEEVAYQIYEDGTFLQFSMNYHRVVIQLLSLGISLTEMHDRPFSEVVYDRAYKSLNFLYQCLQEEKGYLPNYGANDGAWFFQLSNTDYRDFRPQLNVLHELLTKRPLYDDLEIREEALWMGVGSHVSGSDFARAHLIKKSGVIEFPLGGYYLIREQDTFTFIKCGTYKDRPSHADNLHVDVWYKEENLLVDGGSFMYNTDEPIVKYFSGTESHNTVMLGDKDQMLKGPRFTWLNWSQAISAEVVEDANSFCFSGSVKCFSFLNKKIVHKRTVIKEKGVPVWIVKDEIVEKPSDLLLRQLWHTPLNNIDFHSKSSEPKVKEGWRSLYYGQREKIKQIELSTNSNRIETVIKVMSEEDKSQPV